jgi:hypothetical protein
MTFFLLDRGECSKCARLQNRTKTAWLTGALLGALHASPTETILL